MVQAAAVLARPDSWPVRQHVSRATASRESSATAEVSAPCGHWHPPPPVFPELSRSFSERSAACFAWQLTGGPAEFDTAVDRLPGPLQCRSATAPTSGDIRLDADGVRGHRWASFFKIVSSLLVPPFLQNGTSLTRSSVPL